MCQSCIHLVLSPHRTFKLVFVWSSENGEMEKWRTKTKINEDKYEYIVFLHFRLPPPIRNYGARHELQKTHGNYRDVLRDACGFLRNIFWILLHFSISPNHNKKTEPWLSARNIFLNLLHISIYLTHSKK